MNAPPRWPLVVASAGLLLLLAFGCDVASGYTYLGYYEPFGFSYGGWGPGYDVGPWRGGRFSRAAAFGGRQAFRPAPAGRAMPPIPWRARPSGLTRGPRR
jgi:hypothetical protein